MSTAAAIVRTLRPHQWVKNAFVLAPLVFGRHLLDVAYLWRSLVTVLLFCGLSGAVYAFNDVRDVESDRAHPTKCRRPIAAGQLSERTALIVCATLAVVALTTAAILSLTLAAIAGAYLFINLAYSVKLKNVAFVDVLLVGSGFVLRVLAGAVVIAVPASGWLLTCTAMLAIMLALGKRAHELAWSTRTGGTVGKTRAALAGYRLPMLRPALVILGIATTAAYAAYTLSPHTVRFFATDRLVLTTPFAAFGIARFLWLAMWRPSSDSPTDAMLRDLPFLLNLATWTAVVVAIVYG